MAIQSLFLVILSILVILFGDTFSQFLHHLDAAHNYVAKQLSLVFSGTGLGQIIRQILALIIIPIVIGLIPGTLFSMIKRKEMPYQMEVVWFIWIMVAASILLIK